MIKHMHRIIGLLLLSFLTASTTLCHAEVSSQSDNRYQQLLALLRTTTPTHESTSLKTASQSPIGDTSFGVLTLSRQAALETTLALMASNDRFAAPQGDVLFTNDAWENLHLLTGSPSVLDTLGHTKTLFGRLFLAKLLTSPTTDQQRIQQRQELIRTFLVTGSLTNSVSRYLTRISKLQHHLISLGDERHPLYNDDMQLYHYKWLPRRLAPDNRIWQNTAKLLGDAWFLVGPILMAASVHGLLMRAPNAGDKVIQKNNPNTTVHKSFIERSIVGVKALHERSGMSVTAINLAIAGSLSYLIFTAVNTFPWGVRRTQALHYMYHQLKPLTEFFHVLAKLKRLVSRLPALQELSDEIDFEILENDPDVARLREILAGPAFASAATAQLLGGDVVMAVELLKKCRTKIFKGVALLGAFDAYTGLASWYQSSTQDKNSLPVSFASFVATKKPYLSLTDFWHPSLNGTNGKPNSLTLGGESAANNAVVTGLFESGKSMLLHSAALNILCAQTVGLCPAKSYQASPFAALNIYASVKDDIANDRSLFKTELHRALQLLEHIKQMPTGSFSFSVADATFTGTEAGAGQAAAYAVARYLGRLDNSLSIHATNFLSLALLGEQEPTRFTNYYLPSSFNGKAEHSYTLTPGVQEPHLATIIFKEENLPQDMITIMEQQLPQPAEGAE